MLTTPTVARIINVLILCTHNSARSALSEGMLNHWTKQLGKDARVYSADNIPSGCLNPFVLEALTNAGIGTVGYRSRSWGEFVDDDATQMHTIITVCDSAVTEVCPCWPGSPIKVHWGYTDSSNVPGGDEGERQVFKPTHQAIDYRMSQLLALPLDTLSNAELQAVLEHITQA